MNVIELELELISAKASSMIKHREQSALFAMILLTKKTLLMLDGSQSGGNGNKKNFVVCLFVII